MPFSKTEVRRIYGCDHYIGTVTDRYGDDTLQIVSVDNFPHWPAPSMAELVWEFLRHYSRDTERPALCGMTGSPNRKACSIKTGTAEMRVVVRQFQSRQ